MKSSPAFSAISRASAVSRKATESARSAPMGIERTYLYKIAATWLVG